MRNKYILLRHGETKHQALGSGLLYSEEEQFALPITKRAEKEIKQTAKKLKNIDLIYSSDYYRTKQTANIVSKELKIPVKLDKRLRDLNFGIFAGKLGILHKEMFSSKMQRFSKKPSKGESWRDVKKRVVGFLKDIDKKHKNKTILIVTHADPVWLIASFLKGLTEKEALKRRSFEDLWPDVGQIIKL